MTLRLIQTINTRARVWWEGEYTSPENRSGNGLLFVLGHHERHWTSVAAHAYFKAHHQWIIGIAVAIMLALAVKMR
jgi:hypothetical protein